MNVLFCEWQLHVAMVVPIVSARSEDFGGPMFMYNLISLCYSHTESMEVDDHHSVIHE